MRKSITNLFLYFFILAYVLPLFMPMLLNGLEEGTFLPNDYARITDMDYRAVVVDEPNSEGKIVVTERMTFDVHAASEYNGFWELWRDLCEDYVDGLKVHYKVNSVKQILPDGSEIIWEESDKLYWDDYDYVSSNPYYGPGKWYHSEGPYNEEYDRYECVFFYVDNLYREQITFEIEYEMYNAVLRYNDCSDLYIALYSGDTTKYLESFDAEILIPNKDMPKAGNYKVTTYGTNFNSFPVKESSTKNPGYYTFSFNLGEDELQFKPYNEYIEFDLVSFGEDRHVFSEYASRNDYYEDDVLEEIWEEQANYEKEPETYQIIKLFLFAGCGIFSVIMLLFVKLKISKLKTNCPAYKVKSSYVFRDIPSDLDPKFAAALVFCKDKKKEDDSGIYSSILLSLARKKYIELQEYNSSDVMIVLKEELISTEIDTEIETEFNDGILSFVPEPVEEREPLTTSETHYLNLIKRHARDNCISMKEFQNRISIDYDYMDNFVRNIDKSVVDNGVGLGYFQKARYLEPKQKLQASGKVNLFYGFIFLIIANIISYQTPLEFIFGGWTLIGIVFLFLGIYYKVQAHKYVLLTEFGAQEYIKWRGLYNFLKSDTLINEKTYIELPLWEKYLVYATAFGISDKVIKAIKIRCPEIAENSNSIVYSNYCRSGRIRTSGRSFHSSVRHGSSGGYSSGGSFGYGGGGRGGGGGGGGH